MRITALTRLSPRSGGADVDPGTTIELSDARAQLLIDLGAAVLAEQDAEVAAVIAPMPEEYDPDAPAEALPDVTEPTPEAAPDLDVASEAEPETLPEPEAAPDPDPTEPPEETT